MSFRKKSERQNHRSLEERGNSSPADKFYHLKGWRNFGEEGILKKIVEKKGGLKPSFLIEHLTLLEADFPDRVGRCIRHKKNAMKNRNGTGELEMSFHS